MQIASGPLDMGRLTCLENSMDCGLALEKERGKLGCLEDSRDCGVVLW